MLVFSEDFPCDIYFYTLVSGSKVGLPLKVALLNGMAGDILFNCSKWTSKMFEGFLVKQDRWLDILYHSFSIFFFFNYHDIYVNFILFYYSLEGSLLSMDLFKSVCLLTRYKV